MSAPQRSDVLDLLLPDAEPLEGERARRLVTFLRLLSADAGSVRAGTIGVNLSRAREELERVETRGLVGALEGLLRHHLGALLGEPGFSGWVLAPERCETGDRVVPGGCGRSELQAAWSRLETYRASCPGLPAVPGPGEPALDLADRILAWVGREHQGWAPRPSGAWGAWLALWTARRERAAGGPRAGEAAFRARLEDGVSRTTRERCALVAGAAEALLDRGAVRAAATLLEEHLEEVGCSERLTRLLGWTQLLLGCPEEARRVLGALPAGFRPVPPGRSGPVGPGGLGFLPAPLVELRRRVPEWAPLLTGRGPAATGDGELSGARGAGFPGDRRECRDRRELGAAALVVFALTPGSAAEPLHSDVAPGLRDRLASWLAAREDACASVGELEHRMAVEADVCVADRAAGDELRGALSRESARALAVAPVIDGSGEVAGWLHVECEHHLVPSRRRLLELARDWRGPVLGHGRASTVSVGSPAVAAELAPLVRPRPGEHEAGVEAFEELVAALGMKTAQRRWWGVVLPGPHEPGDQPRLVAEGGGALADWEARPGGGRALSRARRTGGLVCFREPDPHLALAAEACSGLALPVRVAGRPVAVLLLESIRRRDFREPDLERLARVARARGVVFRLAQFRDWHRARFGHDVYFDARSAGFGACAADFVLAGGTRTAVTLSGPPGSGKQVLARWIHHEGPDPDAPLKVFPCGAYPGDRAVELLFGCGRDDGILAEAGGGTLVLDDLEELAHQAQAVLLEWLAGEAASGGAAPGAPRPRIIATCRSPLGSVADAGGCTRLRPDLAQRLDRLQLLVPPLRRRRDEIPALVGVIARRFAGAEGLRAPVLEDEALALLWRQPWEGNVRQLENLLYKLALIHPGARVAASHIFDLARRFHLELIKRLPSRHPDPADLRAALKLTLKSSGSLNKTRAALYLGWDPDTLVARMGDLKIAGV